MMIEQNVKYNLYKNCILVKGISRSTICDLQFEKYYLIPNALYNILIAFPNKTINEIKEIYQHRESDIIDDYFDFLLNNQLMFFDDNCDYFPPLSMEWNEPNIISNAIIDLNTDSNFDLKYVFEMLEDLLCQNVQIRCFCDFDIRKIESIMGLLYKSFITSVEWVIPYQNEFGTNQFGDLKEFIKKYSRIFSITFYNYPQSGLIDDQLTTQAFGFIYGTKQNITSEYHCGIIDKNIFSINVKTFTESQKHNTCLNRKISIDVNGDIKNCPSMKKNFGNIKNTTLKDVIEKTDFKDIWTINKDKISTCKECEFRHICTDCRAYLEDPNDIFSKPLKCGYDPHTCKWEEWSTNPLKNDAKYFYENIR